MPTIDVSSEVYRRLQAIARPFEDREPNDVIARVLNDLEAVAAPPKNGEVGARGDLVSHVGSIPHGSRLRARYKGREFLATVENGRVLLNGRTYESLSKAAVAVIRSTGSNRPTENGWRFWEVQDPSGRTWHSAEKHKTS
jgi:hypothetical protein